ncbi:MAG TPA: hypothetical protein VFB96_01170 [Pirellulaceae bacterium]|nr:hypothetical protein [Pirellulaceae bacterium]
MNESFHLTETAGPDGIIHLSLPAEPNRSYDVVVSVTPRAEAERPRDSHRGWSEGFFEATAGKWVGEFPKDYEGDYEKRLEF